MENVRLGIVGCGKIAEHCHIPAVLSSANVEVVAIVDSNPTRLEFIVRSFSLSCLAASSPSVLKGRVDAVLLLLPNYLHASVGCEFLQNGIHVLCEKPLANTTKEARMMCEAAEGNGALLAVGYMSRFYPSVQLMKRLLEERFLGQLEHFEYEYGGTGGWETISNYNLYRNQAGGGVLTANGSHFFDRMLFWFGYPSSAEYSDDSHGGIEANCNATFTFEDGLTGTMRLSKTFPLRNRFRLYGKHGCIEMEDTQQLSLTFLPRHQPNLKHEITTNCPHKTPSDWQYFQLQIEDFIHAIQSGTQPQVPGRQGLSSVSLIEQCYQIRTPMREPWVFETVSKLPLNQEMGLQDSMGPRDSSQQRESDLKRTVAQGTTLPDVTRDSEAPDFRTITKTKAQPASFSGRDRSTTMASDREVVLVTGSTGFIGSRLCEVMYLRSNLAFRPLIHSPAKGSYIARYPLDFVIGDLTDASTVRRAMEGCTSVIHLARGSAEVMRKGLQNLLRAAVEAKVRRFVHISSTAVFGNDPPQAARYETAVAGKTANEYGNIKLQQENLVAAYGRRHHLPFVILRPPQVYGPYSHFTLAVLARLKAGSLPILDGGKHPCNLVYVDNLIECILLSLIRDQAIGETFFVVDKDECTWKECLDGYADLLGVKVPEATSSQLEFPSPPTLLNSLSQIACLLSSNEFRSVASKNPIVLSMGRVLANCYGALPQGWQGYIRSKVKGPLTFARPTFGPPSYDGMDYLIAGQRRLVRHSCEKAERLLGYTAAVNYRRAMEITKEWLDLAKVI